MPDAALGFFIGVLTCFLLQGAILFIVLGLSERTH